MDLTNDDRTMIYGALLWMADKLQSDDAQRARELWAGKGKQAFDAEGNGHAQTITPDTSQDRA